MTREHRSGAIAFCVTHVYDPAGNRLREVADGTRKTFTYDAANQLATSDDSTGRTTYTYDASGNLAIQAAPVGRTTNTWDAENRLLLVQAPAGIINTMVYNSAGLRVQKADSSGTANYVWDGLILLSEADASGGTQAVYTHEPAVYGGLVSQIRNSGGGETSSYYHYDGLGSTDRVTDPTQSVTDSYTYYAYGESAGATLSTVNPFRWVGQLGYHFDADLLQYYIRARHYSPAFARWLSEDPVGYKGGINLYRYVANSPTRGIDPSGQIGQLALGCIPARPSAATKGVFEDGERNGGALGGGTWGLWSLPQAPHPLPSSLLFRVRVGDEVAIEKASLLG